MLKKPPKGYVEELAHKLRSGKACPQLAVEWLERKIGRHPNELDARALRIVKRALKKGG